ncbi:hypothetical protein SteCoe_3146 [Stentor coeruleus]|uniref:non-specific serine/threonine protein kinase n=1 Tax=Stentor coeruleus TaxID=5963 RepID=A0A1R2CXU5_9CILI|nr:hypothetical protein SteCoe_3146 [Stentor coeruleus]
MDLTLISQGAEGKIYTCTFLGKKSIKKERIPRSYRQKSLDTKLRERRLIQESRNLVKVHKEGVPVPGLYFVDTITCSLYMEFITPSISLKNFFIQNPLVPQSLLCDFAGQIGKGIALMHNAQCIHGDLTTSNMLLKPQITLANENLKDFSAADYLINPCMVYFIDLGLSYGSSTPEDMAVDLHVLEKAISSAHPQLENFFVEILYSYKIHKRKADSVLTKLDQVKMRGRKRLAFG